MNGRDLALGLVGVLALAGVARRRGSASLETWPNADALARTFTDTMANATAQQMGRWAKKNGLVYIGSGQSRAVFAEPDGTRVLKLVFSSYGRESNRDEARAWREASAAMRAHLVPVLAADPMGSWLVMERVKPLRATQHIPKQAMDALKGCGFLDLRRPNFAADGRLLDYGAMLFWRQEAGCRAEGSAARIDPALAYQAWNALPAGVRMDIEVFQAGVLVGKTPALEARLAHAEPAVERAMRPIREAVSALGGVRLYRGEPATVHPVPRAWLSWTDDQRMAQQFAGPKGKVRVREVGPEEIVAVFPHGEAMEWLIREQVQEGSRNERPPEEILEAYSYGKCFWLALALHERYGWPLVAEVETDRADGARWISHAWVEMPDGREFDIYGSQRRVDRFGGVEQRVSPKDAFAIIRETSPLSPKEIRAYVKEANEILDRYFPALGGVQEGSRARPTQRTDPALWEAVKAQVTASDKGGRPGQWSARKAQRSVQLYKERGGGYLGPKDPDNSLARWTKQDWRTRSGGESLQTGERYLPAAAFDLLTPAEVGATTRAKRAGLARGQQFTPQPANIARKTKKAREGAANVIAPSGYDQTAMARTGPSAPVQHLRAHAPALLRGRILDFGSGRGADAKALRATPYDPHHPDAAVRKRPTGTFGTVLGIYVLNVLPKAERHAALRESAAYVKRGGHLVLAVRPQADVAATVTDWSRNGDGHQLVGEDGARDRFQRGYSADQLAREVRAVLGDTFAPVPLPALSGSVVGAWRRA